MVTANGLDNLKNLLTVYFSNDDKSRFQFEKIVGQGMDSIAWRLRYRPSYPSRRNQEWKRIVLKHPRTAALYDIDFVDTDLYHDELAGVDEEEPKDQIENEKIFLEILKYAKHIVKQVVVPDDPLQLAQSPLRPHRLENWIFLEWVENGTLQSFLERVLEAGISPLPSRLLWRFFMCLIRICIAMAWPPQRTRNQRPTLESVGEGEISGIVHSDIHLGNIMIDSFGASQGEKEHELTPLLKLIDFGDARKAQIIKSSQSYSWEENIFDVACAMVDLITLSNAGSKIDVQDEDKSVLIYPTDQGPAIRTAGIALSPDVTGNDPVAGLDSDLIRVVCLCLAINPLDRPKLPELVKFVESAIEERDYNWYTRNTLHPNPWIEKDENVLDILSQCILDANCKELQ